jgi:hypothetical protein
VGRQCVAGVALLLGESPQSFFTSFMEYSKRTKLVSSLSPIQRIQSVSSLVSSLLFLNLQETEGIKMNRCSVNFCRCLPVQIVQMAFLDRHSQASDTKILQGDKQQ